MSLEYVRKTYNVPAWRGVAIRYISAGNERFGVITGAYAGRIRVRMDGCKRSVNIHPEDEGLTYLCGYEDY